MTWAMTHETRPADVNRRAAHIQVTYHASARPPGDAAAQRQRFLRSQSGVLVRCACVLLIVVVLGWRVPGHVLAGVLLVTTVGGLTLTAAAIWSAGRRARVRLAERVVGFNPGGGGWVSKPAILLGPFDERSGFTGSSDFGTPASRRRGWVAACVVLTREGVGLLTADGHRPTLGCALHDLRSIDLFAGTGQRALIRPFWSAWKSGRMVLTSTDGHTATIAGLAPRPVADMLMTLGAQVQRR